MIGIIELENKGWIEKETDCWVSPSHLFLLKYKKGEYWLASMKYFYLNVNVENNQDIKTVLLHVIVKEQQILRGQIANLKNLVNLQEKDILQYEKDIKRKNTTVLGYFLVYPDTANLLNISRSLRETYKEHIKLLERELSWLTQEYENL